MTRIGDSVDFLDYREGSGDTVEVFDIAVNSERSRGIGSAMLQELLSRHRGKFVWALVRETNEEAHKFYRRNGFQRVGHVYSMYGDESALVFGRTA